MVYTYTIGEVNKNLYAQIFPNMLHLNECVFRRLENKHEKNIITIYKIRISKSMTIILRA